MEDVAVDGEISACWIKLSNKENGNCIESEENVSDLQPSSSSLTTVSTDTRAIKERERKPNIRRRVEWILFGVMITAVWTLIVGLPIMLYHLPQVRQLHVHACY